MKDYSHYNDILKEAHMQMYYGKGRDRHIIDEEDLGDQISLWIQKRGFDFCRGQAVKKLDESLRLNGSASRRELLGAINYIVFAIMEIDNEHPRPAVQSRGAQLEPEGSTPGDPGN